MFDSERAFGVLWTAEEFVQFAPANLSRTLDNTAILAVRAARADLFKRWAAVETGASLNLDFAV